MIYSTLLYEINQSGMIILLGSKTPILPLNTRLAPGCWKRAMSCWTRRRRNWRIVIRWKEYIGDVI